MDAIPELSNQLNGDISIEETRIRRSPNPFMIFGEQYRKVLAKKYGNLNNKQISKIMRYEWYKLAELKRKNKTSQVCHNSRTKAPFILPIIKPFCGDRSISMPNTTFGCTQSPTVRYIRPIINRGTGDPVIGIKKLRQPFAINESNLQEITDIEHKVHNYSVQPNTEQSFPQSFTFENNWGQLNKSEVKINEIDNQFVWNQSIDYLGNFLPPVHNPNTEVMPVFQGFCQPLNEDSKDQIDCHFIKREFEDTEEIGKKYRKVLAEKFGNLNNKQISKIMGDEWKKIDPNTKSHYHKLAKEVYATHIQKYPDYHYNPLEARQRKAERKRKYKTSQVCHNSRTKAPFILPIIKPFGGDRSISMPNTTFGCTQSPTVRYIRPIINRGTGDSVIGIKKLRQPFAINESNLQEITDIEHKEYNYSVQPNTEQSFPQSITFENNWRQLNESEVKINETDNQFDWNQSIDSALRSTPPNEVLSDGITGQICSKDMETLKGPNWLNDGIINFYLSLIVERGKNDNYPTVHAFNTFFYTKLRDNGPQSLKRWTRKLDVFSNHFIFIPIHLGMHWCLAVIDFVNKKIEYYDSMGGNNMECVRALKAWLQAESLDKKKCEFPMTDWTLQMAKDIPQQMNGSDCGVFSCKYAEYISRNAKVNFSQADMPYFRRRMFYEILTKQLI